MRPEKMPVCHQVGSGLVYEDRRLKHGPEGVTTLSIFSNTPGTWAWSCRFRVSVVRNASV